MVAVNGAPGKNRQCQVWLWRQMLSASRSKIIPQPLALQLVGAPTHLILR